MEIFELIFCNKTKILKETGFFYTFDKKFHENLLFRLNDLCYCKGYNK